MFLGLGFSCFCDFNCWVRVINGCIGLIKVDNVVNWKWEMPGLGRPFSCFDKGRIFNGVMVYMPVFFKIFYEGVVLVGFSAKLFELFEPWCISNAIFMYS